MPNFSQLRDRAIGLTKAVLKHPPIAYYFSSFFCPCIPSLSNVDIADDIGKIEETAAILDKYYGVSEEEKLAVLQGLYFLILRNYESTVKQLVYRPLITVLLNHLEIDSLESIDREEYGRSLKALAEFIGQIHQKDTALEMQVIISVLPIQLVVNIRNYLYQNDESDDSWGSTLSNLFSLIRN